MEFLAEESGRDFEDCDPADTLIGRRVAARLPVRIPARFQVGKRSVNVVVLDVSDSGARLGLSFPPPKGVRGVLHWEEIECPCEVVWAAGDVFGVRFAHAVRTPEALVHEAKRTRTNPLLIDVPTPPPTSVVHRPAAPAPLQRSAEIRQGDRWIRVRLKSISRDGFEIGWFAGCQDRQPIWLRGPGLPSLKGRVVWSDNLSVGCKLDAPLHEAVLEHVRLPLGTP